MFLDSIFSLIILGCLSFAIYKLAGLNASLTPFVALCSIVATCTLLGLFNLLMPAIWLVYILSIAAFALAIKKCEKNLKEEIKDFFTPGVIMFFISCLLIFIVLAVQKPGFTQWDEYSLWGTGQKLTKLHGAIYTFYDSSLVGRTTPPALAVLSTFFQPFGAGYLEWKSFFAYDVLLFASFAAWTAAFKRDKWNYAFLVYFFGFMTPFIFEVYTKIIYLVPAYVSLMADVPLGAVFAGAVAVYLFGKKKENANHILAMVPILFMFTLMKDMGFAFSLIAVFICVFDALFSQKEFVFLKLKGLWGKLSAAVVLGTAVVSSFLAWTVHMSMVLATNRFELGGSESMGMVEMVLTGIKELFSPIKSTRFAEIQAAMLKALVTKPVSMFGNGLVVILLITAIFIFAAIMAKRKKDILRIVSLYVSTAVGFVAYYIFYIFLYTYVFSASNAIALPSYERYIYPCYILWLALGIMSLSIAIIHPRFRLVSRAGLYAIVLSTFAIFSYFVSYENTFLGYNGAYNPTAKNVRATVDSLEGAIGAEDRIFCHTTPDDSGERWFIFTYELSPNVIVKDLPWFDTTDMEEYNIGRLWREKMIVYLEENKVTHFLLDYGTNNLKYAFGDDFKRDVNEFGLLKTGYYKVIYGGEKGIEFELVKIGTVAQ